MDGVREVHDLHLWTLTSGMDVGTAHLVVAPSADRSGVLQEARAILRDRFGLEDVTVQIEAEGETACVDPHSRSSAEQGR